MGSLLLSLSCFCFPVTALNCQSCLYYETAVGRAESCFGTQRLVVIVSVSGELQEPPPDVPVSRAGQNYVPGSLDRLSNLHSGTRHPLDPVQQLDEPDST